MGDFVITIYNKIEKNIENTSGFQEVLDISMLERPFLLCISAYDNFSKAIYGIIREGAQAARLQTTQGPAAKFSLNEFPADFLGVRFEEDENYQQPYTEIADQFLFPFLKRNGDDFDSIVKQARKINLFTYCEGANTYKGIEDRLFVLLKREQYPEEIIKQILSQISLVALQSKLETGELYATSISFIDINDLEAENQKTDSYRNLLTMHGHDYFYSPLGESNGVLYVYNGSGVHRIKKFFKEENNIAKPAVCACVSMFLENSILNTTTDDLIPIDVEQILSRLEQYSNDTIAPSVLLQQLDDSLSYGGATRYTDSGIEVRMELDYAYKVLRKTNDRLIRALQEQERQNDRLKAVIRGVNEFSSKTTFEQILTYSHMWYSNEERQLLSLASDKQIRAAVEDSMY